jgi:hypothetical protein
LGPRTSQDSTPYINDPAYVGSITTFSGGIPSRGKCANCAKQKVKGTLHRGQVSISLPLLLIARDRTKNLSSLLPQHGEGPDKHGQVGVERYLRDNLLSWIVVKVRLAQRRKHTSADHCDLYSGGVEVPVDTVHNLKVFLFQGHSKHDKDATVLAQYSAQ